MSFDKVIVILKELSEERKRVLFGESKRLKRFLNDNEDNGIIDYVSILINYYLFVCKNYRKMIFIANPFLISQYIIIIYGRYGRWLARVILINFYNLYYIKRVNKLIIL